MPSKTSKMKPAVTLPTIPKDLLDQFVSGPMSAEAVNAASMAFKKALIERALGAELSHHLGYPSGAEKPGEVSNHRNGVSSKTVLRSPPGNHGRWKRCPSPPASSLKACSAICTLRRRSAKTSCSKSTATSSWPIV